MARYRAQFYAGLEVDKEYDVDEVLDAVVAAIESVPGVTWADTDGAEDD